MKSATFLAAIGLTGLLLGGAAQAATTTITFNGLPGPNGALFAGLYMEGGFSVSAPGGNVFQGTIFGNPAPSLVVGSVFGGGPNGIVSVTAGGSNFSLTSFDLAGNNGAADFTVTGFEGLSQIFSLSGNVNAGTAVFQTVAGEPGQINDLVFSLTSNGTSLNLDNIVVATVPEPSTWAMMLLGLAGLGFAFRQSRRKVPFA
jgi:hypothetical protein